MIGINKAIELIEKNKSTSETEILDLKSALGHTTAKDVFSPINMPPFNQSAMDGYAIHHDSSISTYTIIGEIQAGMNPSEFNLKKAEAVRIFTGAETPKGCNSIIQQEWCIEKDSTLKFNKEIKEGLNIRLTGEQIKERELALTKGAELKPESIGFLATLGISKVEVIKKPKIGILITGNELIGLNDDWSPGKIYESNSYLLEAVLKKYGYHHINIYKTEDSFSATKESAKKAILENDVVLVSGGISVGDYDHVYSVLKELNVQNIFYKVKQKPGKPLFFGKLNNKAIFGLPGNPGSALTCFYIYVLRYLSLSTSCIYPLKKDTITLLSDYKKKPGRGEFVKAIVKEKKAEICSFQNSSMLKAFIEGNSLIYMDEEVENPKSGETFSCYLLL